MKNKGYLPHHFFRFFMALNCYNAFYLSAYKEEYESESEEYESESEEEDAFERSDIELYPNKQNFQNVFSNKLFGTEGEYFFPGTFDEATVLTTLLGAFKDQEKLFSTYSFSDLLVDKIKEWSYDKLTCSVLYYYLNYKIAKNDLTPVDWGLVGNLIQSPAISRDVFSFVKQNNVLNFSSKSDHIVGFIHSLIFPSSSTYYNSCNPVVDVRIYYRLLKLANIEKSIIRDLIKRTITEQNRKAIVYFLNNQLKSRKK